MQPLFFQACERLREVNPDCHHEDQSALPPDFLDVLDVPVLLDLSELPDFDSLLPPLDLPSLGPPLSLGLSAALALLYESLR